MSYGITLDDKAKEIIRKAIGGSAPTPTPTQTPIGSALAIVNKLPKTGDLTTLYKLSDGSIWS
jgi:hypothetical protein